MTNEAKFLVDIATKAGEISKEKFTVKSKGEENDLITNLDVKIENFLIDQIKEQYPTFDIVSEEFNYNQKVTDNCFIIDPIDGTINFAHNIPLWAIQIACVKDGKTCASVLNFPKLNELYYADKTGAYLNNEKISVKIVPVNKATYAIEGKNTLTCFQNMNQFTTSARKFGAVCSSLAFVAAGRIHGAVFRIDNPWDYAPGLFLIKMAGGAVADESGFHAGAMNEEFLNILKTQTAKKEESSR